MQATDQNMEQTADDPARWQASVPTGLTKPFLLGLLTVGIFLTGFGFWALRAPISGAAIAPGLVIASGQNQEVGHLEGGIIREIAVREGESVKSGQPLVYLDETQAQTDRNRVNQSIISLSATLVRARAELSGETEISFPGELTRLARETGNEEMLDLQRAEFISRLQQHNSELNVMEEQIRAIDEEISGVRLQIEAEQRKLGIINEELEGKKSLLERGLTPKNLYNQLLRTQADTEGAIGRLTATIGQRKGAISEVRERQESLRATRRATASTEINRTRPEIADLREQLTSRADILERMIIRAPVDGVIVNISKNTIGSVVSPGETILELLPTSSDLIISARVTPQDVDVVEVGQQASVRFIALNTRTTPEIPATIEYISADRLVDEATKEPYFDARLKLTDDLPENFDPAKIYPGCRWTH